MSVIRVRTTAPADGKLVIELPEDLRVGEVDVEVRSAPPEEGNVDAVRRTTERIRERQRENGTPRRRGKEEIDDYIRRERASWE